MNYSVCRLFCFAFVLLPVAVLCAENTAARQSFLDCFVGQPSVNVLEQRLGETLGQVGGTEVEDDVLLAMANIHIQMKKYDEAMPLLEKVRHDAAATCLDLSLFGRGGVSIEEMMILKDRPVSPNRSSDQALLLLSRVYHDKDEPDKAWKVLQELRNKYPKGDRVEEDRAVIESLKNRHGRGSQPPSALATETMKYHPRPHLIGLQEQRRICRGEVKYSEHSVDILAEIIELYLPVLTSKETTDFATEGIDLIRKKAKEMQTDKTKKQEEVFAQALRMAQE